MGRFFFYQPSPPNARYTAKAGCVTNAHTLHVLAHSAPLLTALCTLYGKCRSRG